jgi:hypothetical protein
LLALVFVAGVVACTATPSLRWIRFSESDDPEPSCLAYNDEDSCLQHDCGWCSNSGVLGASIEGCVSESIAKLVPKALADCKVNDEPADDDDDDDFEAVIEALDKKHKPKPKAPTSCGDNKEKHNCLHLGAEEGDCAWCEGDFMPASCVATMAAKWIPEQVAKCKMPKKHKTDSLDSDGPSDKPKAPVSCGDNKEKHDCLDGAEEGDCAWCEGDFMPASCVGVKAAEWIPEQVAKCKMPKKHKTDSVNSDGPSDDKPKPKAPVSCGDNKEKHDCLDGAEEGDCAWCEGDFMPASCVGVKAAEWIPEQVAKCKMPKKHKKEISAPANKMAATCMDIKDDRECVKKGSKEGECAWCSGKFLPSACLGVDKAKYIPEQVATCKMPKKHNSLTVEKKHDSKKGGGGYPFGGGDYPSGGGDYPSGGGDYPSGGGGQGQGCMALKSKKKCLKGTDTEACAWCGKSSFLGSPCVSESTAKYIPSFMSKCKMGKGPKKSDKVAVA